MQRYALCLIAIVLSLTAVVAFSDNETHKKPAVDTTKLPRTPSAEGAVAYIISPRDGETVDKTFTIRFGLRGMGVAPATVQIPNTGHHHLLIDDVKMPDLDMPMPPKDTLKHFGGGQTETDLTLAPGEHKLRLVLGDWLHVPHAPPVASEVITITVK